jgi:hypothetical protein
MLDRSNAALKGAKSERSRAQAEEAEALAEKQQAEAEAEAMHADVADMQARLIYASKEKEREEGFTTPAWSLSTASRRQRRKRTWP